MRLIQAFCVTLLTTMGLVSAHAATNEERLFDAAQFELENGLRVVILPDHRAPVVTQMVWYRVGSADEEPGKGGLAHFLEHLMFKGTERFPGKTFSETVSRHGGSENAFTSRDITAYYQIVPRKQLQDIMAMEADRMMGLTLDEGEVNAERGVVREERRLRVDNQPSSILSEQVTLALYGDHPYAKPIIGSMEDIDGLSRQNAFDFYRRFYSPSNAVLVLVGDISIGDGLALAKQYYGPLPSFDVDFPERPAIDIMVGPLKPLSLDHELVSDIRWQRRYIAPGTITGGPEKAAALTLLADILGTGTNSRLYKHLVVDKQIATTATAWYSSLSLDDSSFTFYAAARPNIDAAALGVEMDAVIAELLENGTTQNELQLFIDSNINDMIYARDNVESAARIFGNALILGLDIHAINQWPAMLRKVTPADVMAVAREVLSPNNRQITAILRPKQAEAQ